MKPLIASIPFVFTILLSLNTGCLKWEPGWKQAAEQVAEGDVAVLMAKAEKLENTADTKEKVQALVASYEDAIRVDPDNLKALSRLGTYYWLLGYGYSQDDNEMLNNVMRSIDFNERAMYTNQEFKKLTDRGETVWEASRVLTEKEMSALYHWYTAAGYLLSRQSIVGKLINIKWAGRTKQVLDRMTAISPGWNNGAVHMSWAVYYAVLPPFLGGDIKKSIPYFKKALLMGPTMIYFYIVRATYLHKKMKNRKAFIEDLTHAAAMDPHNTPLKYPVASFYKQKAEEMLAHPDEYFK